MIVSMEIFKIFETIFQLDKASDNDQIFVLIETAKFYPDDDTQFILVRPYGKITCWFEHNGMLQLKVPLTALSSYRSIIL